jgi:hypothetical protein
VDFIEIFMAVAGTERRLEGKTITVNPLQGQPRAGLLGPIIVVINSRTICTRFAGTRMFPSLFPVSHWWTIHPTIIPQMRDGRQVRAIFENRLVANRFRDIFAI